MFNDIVLITCFIQIHINRFKHLCISAEIETPFFEILGLCNIIGKYCKCGIIKTLLNKAQNSTHPVQRVGLHCWNSANEIWSYVYVVLCCCCSESRERLTLKAGKKIIIEWTNDGLLNKATCYANKNKRIALSNVIFASDLCIVNCRDSSV